MSTVESKVFQNMESRKILSNQPNSNYNSLENSDRSCIVVGRTLVSELCRPYKALTLAAILSANRLVLTNAL